MFDLISGRGLIGKQKMETHMNLLGNRTFHFSFMTNIFNIGSSKFDSNHIYLLALVIWIIMLHLNSNKKGHYKRKHRHNGLLLLHTISVSASCAA